jgi:hypothetical protein
MQRRFKKMQRQMGLPFAGFYRTGPILVCEQGAKRRALDLEVAQADAKRWWETGEVPLRATPLAIGGKAAAQTPSASKAPGVRRESDVRPGEPVV